MTESCVHPAVHFLGSAMWEDAGWSGTTFRWHPTGEAPPVMGLVFDHAEAGRGVFRRWVDVCGHTDRDERLGVTILNDEFEGEAPGYIVHLCPDYQHAFAQPAGGAARVETVPLVPVFRAAKMDFMTEAPRMLETFVAEYRKHGEYLLAPVVRESDGQLYVQVELGVIKKHLNLITVADLEASLLAAGLDRQTVDLLLRGRPVGPN